MKFGLSYNTAYFGADPDRMAAAARHAEKCGFESFYMSEHIVVYPGATLPDYVSFPSDLAVADPLGCLAYVAAATSTLLLGTGVLLLPYHHPVVLGKQLATIDVLSRGRMSLLTVGLGVLPGEAAAAGVDFRTRGRRADEAIDVLRLLWGGDAAGVSFQGEFFSLTAACSFPKPHDGRILLVHVGGSSLAAARRAGRRGDGYFPGGRLTSEQRAEQITVMRAEAAAAGHDPARNVIGERQHHCAKTLSRGPAASTPAAPPAPPDHGLTSEKPATPFPLPVAVTVVGLSPSLLNR